MHRNGLGESRSEIIAQVKKQAAGVRDFANYVPIGEAVNKLRNWAAQGAEICYLTSLTENKKARGDEIIGKDGLRIDNEILRKYSFPEGTIYHREISENYADVVARINPLPNILIEDDCESIGKEEITYTQLNPALQKKIGSIIIPEFGGIDHLPDRIEELPTVKVQP